MPLRVIAGVARGRKLRMVPGTGTRPIMDRVKEALFNILGDAVYDANFLDLFAGTGSVGIEALSRGAARAVFVDNARAAVKTIVTNLEITGLAERAEIKRMDVADYLSAEPAECFEYVFIAPPQYQTIWKDTLLALDAHPEHLCPDAVVIVQIDPLEKEEVLLSSLLQFDERRYGNTLLLFFERPGS